MTHFQGQPGSILEDRYQQVVAEVESSTRVEFLKKTYLHLFGAVVAFALLEVIYFQTGIVYMLTDVLFGGGGMGWLVVLGVFLVVSTVAHHWASSATSVGTQYAGLGLYVVAQSIIFAPLLLIADHVGGGMVIGSAAITTLLCFGAITGYVLTTKADFSFLGGILTLAAFASMAVIVCAIIFGFELGMIFTVLMIVLASGFILYDTSQVLHKFVPTQHVAASLALFASLALLFWYVLRLAIILNQE